MGWEFMEQWYMYSAPSFKSVLESILASHESVITSIRMVSRQLEDGTYHEEHAVITTSRLVMVTIDKDAVSTRSVMMGAIQEVERLTRFVELYKVSSERLTIHLLSGKIDLAAEKGERLFYERVQSIRQLHAALTRALVPITAPATSATASD